MACKFGDHILIHLDLKRSPIKIDYLEKFFQKIRECGANGLLVEWEDTFPYSGHLEDIGSAKSSSKAYSVEEVGRIVELAKNYELNLIPLVQTFGHLEFVLKHTKWMHLREKENYPSSMCPSHPEAIGLATSMIDQILTLIPDTKFIHIGADEVWHMRICKKCSPITKERLFLTHVMKVLKHLQSHHPNVKPIMWDDMLRPININTLKEFEIGSFVQPMIWYYQPMETFNIPEDILSKYEKVFNTVWVASAFKGATRSCQILPVIKVHVSNHLSWLSLLEKHGHRFKIQGIAMTGWSRFDHFATLCELLPVSIPCLAICLCVWTNRTFNDHFHNEVARSLGYTHGSALSSNPYPRPKPIACVLSFAGWKVALGAEWLENVRCKHRCIVNSDQVNTWMNSWQLKNNLVNPMQIECLLQSLRALKTEWDTMEQFFRTNMADIYYDSTIDEWIGTLLEPPRQQVISLIESATKHVQKNSSQNTQ
ncbi:hexosaminidase D isoform X2 [Nilaparvata lugens]|uniref:hexosaminidase D isoform X1 n=1 Tax=Nilaparvata lugens TaxID=108931 RepID=UPI00193E8B1B|nr:hexosaminidase D isoform X1 [Nilaparvata lugens]XP_039290938.1 hexosaminidase D isoform X2 [Nilaparvata lugens]